MALNLVPNRILGYRINPDWYSFNVVMVKEHGPSSKNAGQEYSTPLGYHRTLAGASNAIFNHVLRAKAMASQEELEAMEGSVADVRALQDAIEVAVAETNKAVAELAARIDALPMTRSQLVRAMGSAAAEEELPA